MPGASGKYVDELKQPNGSSYPPMYFQVLDSTVKILGSLHMVPTGVVQVPRWAQEAYLWCDDLVIEHDPATFSPHFKGTESLQTKLSPALYEQLQSLWPSQGALAPLHELKPWAALIGVAALSQSVVEGVEPHFLRWAKEESKLVKFLEDPKTVAAAFDSVPIDDIQTAINFAIQNRLSMQDRLLEMHAAWLNLDTDQLLDAAKKTPLFTVPTLTSAVLENRNRAWLPEIEKLLKTQRKTLVVVGALHLCGKNSVQALLVKNACRIASVEPR